MAEAALVVIEIKLEPAVISGIVVATGSSPSAIHKVGKGMVKIVVTTGADPPIVIKAKETTASAKAPMLTSNNSVMRRSHFSELEMVATYSMTLAKTPSWKSNPVPNSSTVVPACSLTLRAALNVANPDVTVISRGSISPSRLESQQHAKENVRESYNPSSLISPVSGLTVIKVFSGNEKSNPAFRLISAVNENVNSTESTIPIEMPSPIAAPTGVRDWKRGMEYERAPSARISNSKWPPTLLSSSLRSTAMASKMDFSGS